MTIHVLRAGTDGTHTQTGVANNVYAGLTVRTDFNYQGAAGFDSGAEFNNLTGVWTPQAGPIIWLAQLWVANQSNAANNLLVASMFKNGVDWQAGIGGARINVFANTADVKNMGMDIANGTDTYQIKVFMTTADGLASGQVQLDPRHVWFNGMSFGS